MHPAPANYTRTAVALHWILALLIIGNLAFGLYVAGLPVSPAKLSKNFQLIRKTT